MDAPFTLLRSEKRHHGKIVDLTVDHLQYPSGIETIREVVEHPGGAVIVCLFPNNDILLLEQYRYPFRASVWELPAGKLERGEDPLLCAQRELREETGYTAHDWRHLTSLYTTPGFCDEVLHIYCASGPEPHPDGQALEEGETSIVVHRMPIAQAAAMIDRKEIVDAKTIAGIFLTLRTRGIQ